MVGPESEVDKRLSEAESRVDSGIGYSFGSTEFSSGVSMDSLRRYVESNKSRDTPQRLSADVRSHSDYSTSSLQNQLRNLSIAGSDKTDSRCDSERVESGVYSLEESSSGFVCETALAECHLTPDSISSFDPVCVINTQELEELFSQDEDGDT